MELDDIDQDDIPRVNREMSSFAVVELRNGRGSLKEGERFINIVSYHLASSAVRQSIVHQLVEVG